MPQIQSQLVYLTSTHDVLLQPQGLLMQLASLARLFWPGEGSRMLALENALQLCVQVKGCTAGIPKLVHPVRSPLQNVLSFFVHTESCRQHHCRWTIHHASVVDRL